MTVVLSSFPDFIVVFPCFNVHSTLGRAEALPLLFTSKIICLFLASE